MKQTKQSVADRMAGARATGGWRRQLAAALTAAFLVLAMVQPALAAETVGAPVAAEAAEQVGEPVQLHMRLVQGEVRQYAMTMNTAVETPEGMAFPVELTAGFRYLTLAAHPDGTATVVLHYDDMTLTTPEGTESVASPLGDMSIRMTPSGQVVDVQIEGPLAEELPFDPSALLGSQGQLPDRPLRIGESFEDTISLPMALPGAESDAPMTITSRTTLADVTDVDGREVAHLIQTMSVPALTLPVGEGAEIRMAIDGTGTSEVPLDTGWVSSSDMQITIQMAISDPSLPAPVELTMHMNMTLQLVSEGMIRGK